MTARKAQSRVVTAAASDTALTPADDWYTTALTVELRVSPGANISDVDSSLLGSRIPPDRPTTARDAQSRVVTTAASDIELTPADDWYTTALTVELRVSPGANISDVDSSLLGSRIPPDRVPTRARKAQSRVVTAAASDIALTPVVD